MAERLTEAFAQLGEAPRTKEDQGDDGNDEHFPGSDAPHGAFILLQTEDHAKTTRQKSTPMTIKIVRIPLTSFQRACGGDFHDGLSVSISVPKATVPEVRR